MDFAYKAKNMIVKKATVTTYGKTAYTTLKGICKLHKAIIITDKTKGSKIFHWGHAAISNTKKNYLNKFCC